MKSVHLIIFENCKDQNFFVLKQRSEAKPQKERIFETYSKESKNWNFERGQKPDWSVVALTGNKNTLRLREIDRPWAEYVLEREQVLMGLREIVENRGIDRVNVILLLMIVVSCVFLVRGRIKSLELWEFVVEKWELTIEMLMLLLVVTLWDSFRFLLIFLFSFLPQRVKSLEGKY